MHFVLFCIAFLEICLVHKMCSKEQIKSAFLCLIVMSMHMFCSGIIKEMYFYYTHRLMDGKIPHHHSVLNTSSLCTSVSCPL